MPKVKVPPPYQGPTGGLALIEVEGATVAECVDAVGALYPGFREQVVDTDGRVHRFVKLFVNGDEIDRAATDTRVESEDEIEVLASVAGG